MHHREPKDFDRKRLRLVLLLFLPFLLLLRSPLPGRPTTTVLTGIEPRYTLARPGTEVVVSGENLPGHGLLLVGNMAVPEPRWVSPRTVKFSLPAHLDTGTHPVRVVGPGAQVAQLPSALTVMGSATSPLIARVEPAEARPGTRIRVHGHQFDGAALVLAAGRECATRLVSPGVLEALLPDGLPAGTCPLTVRNPTGEKATSTELLSVLATP